MSAERLISRDNAIVAAALAAATILAWVWLSRPMSMDLMVAPATTAYVGAAFTMWSLMMVAMMLPSASPMILLYARFARTRFGGAATIGTTFFILSYVLVWTGFSLLASLLQAVLVARGSAGAMDMAIGSQRLGGGLLIAAGLYQLTPLKDACLEACRSPIAFLSRGIRPGVGGALRLGLAHGLYCLGCCWALMLLLFVGGVMNLAWVVGLAVIVAAEKLLPWKGVRIAVAVGLIGVGIALVASS